MAAWKRKPVPILSIPATTPATIHLKNLTPIPPSTSVSIYDAGRFVHAAGTVTVEVERYELET
jgi:hypothetical protein